MNKPSISKLLLLGGALLLAAPAQAKMDCSNIAGNWAGTMAGKFNGDTSLSIKANCRVRWKLPDGRINKCKYQTRKGDVEYSCSLGSRGSVVISDGAIEMQNIYTARKHGAYLVTVSKLK